MAAPSDTTLKLPAPDQVIGGRYRLGGQLGAGGMGLVFHAQQLGVGNRVAIKFLDPERWKDDTRVKRFLQEAKVSLAVAHPGAAQLLDAGRDAGLNLLYLVFEYVEGEDLREVLRREGRLSFEEAREVALKVAEVLAFAHQRGVVHRDVKPENLRLRRDLAGTHVRVLDFGIARLMHGQGVRLTAEGQLAGTPRYMAPEQVNDAPIDARTDVYQLGLVLFEMLAGRPPFTAKQLAQVLWQQLHEALPSVATLLPGAPAAEVDALLARACAKQPEERFRSLEAFALAVKALSGRGWPAPPSPGTGEEPPLVHQRNDGADTQLDTTARRVAPAPARPQPEVANAPRPSAVATRLEAPHLPSADAPRLAGQDTVLSTAPHKLVTTARPEPVEGPSTPLGPTGGVGAFLRGAVLRPLPPSPASAAQGGTPPPPRRGPDTAIEPLPAPPATLPPEVPLTAASATVRRTARWPGAVVALLLLAVAAAAAWATWLRR